MSASRLGFLGSFTVDDQDGAGLISAPRQRSLFAGLAFRAGQPVARDTLIKDIWDDDDLPEDPGGTFRTYMVRLRAAADRVGLSILPNCPGLRLDISADDVDALRFQRLLNATGRLARVGKWTEARAEAVASLDLWRDTVPLAGIPDCPLKRREVRRLTEGRLLALKYKFEADIRLGRHREVIPELAGLTADHPFDEDLRELHMRALWLSSRPAEALDVYYDVRERLEEKYGTFPGKALYLLQQEIAAQDPSRDL